nr:hypothetical protein [uncultured Holophaga sp.]
MSQPTPLDPVKRSILAFVCLGAIHQLSPWPGPQALFLAFLVLAVAPGFHSPVAALLWSAAAGWILEGSLRMYPHLGGTALANLIVCLLAHWHFRNRPPDTRIPYWGQLALFQVGLLLLTHLCVRIAAGPHPWGWSWLWPLVGIPFWGSLSLWLRLPDRRR